MQDFLESRLPQETLQRIAWEYNVLLMRQHLDEGHTSLP
jgi:hypothetical protein